MIRIINYGMGNIRSVASMLRKIGAGVEIVSDPAKLCGASKIILPGVGAFDTGMSNLKAYGFLDILNELAIEKKVPVLGICLGMQLLGQSSNEGKLKGLGWIPCPVKRFDFSSLEGGGNLKIPHMGWNFVNPKRDHQLFRNVPSPMRFYFVHSYHFACDTEEFVVAKANYGYDFPCAVAKDNVLGVQFHPEKSHKYGLQLLKNFVEFSP